MSVTFYLVIRVIPTPKNELFNEVEGALASCWVCDDDQVSASVLAAFKLTQLDWTVVGKTMLVKLPRSINTSPSNGHGRRILSWPLEFQTAERKDIRKWRRILPWIQAIEEHEHVVRVLFVICTEGFHEPPKCQGLSDMPMICTGLLQC